MQTVTKTYSRHLSTSKTPEIANESSNHSDDSWLGELTQFPLSPRIFNRKLNAEEEN